MEQSVVVPLPAVSLFGDRCSRTILPFHKLPKCPGTEMGFRKAITAIIFVVHPATISTADDWPAFRGPERNGHATVNSLPTEWSTQPNGEKNIAWKCKIPGEGWSSPVVAGSRVFLTAAVRGKDSPEGSLSLRLYAIDKKRGKIIGSVEVFDQKSDKAPKIHNKNSHASPTPIVEEDRVYVHFGHQGTACVNVSGKILWKNRSFPYRPVHGNGGSPALVDDKLVFSCDGAKDPQIVALDKESGRVAWTRSRESDATKKFSFSTPQVIDINGQSQIVSVGSNCVCGLNPDDGTEIWRVRYDGYSVIPRPVFGNGLLFVATGYDSPSVLAIRPTGQGDLTESHVAWTMKKGSPHTPSLLLIDDLLYMISDRGVATCVKAESGEPVWQQRIGGNFSASPVYAAGRIYLQSEQGEAIVIAASPEFREIARNSMSERTLASYAVADDAIFVRTEEHLYRIQQ